MCQYKNNLNFTEPQQEIHCYKVFRILRDENGIESIVSPFYGAYRPHVLHECEGLERGTDYPESPKKHPREVGYGYFHCIKNIHGALSYLRGIQALHPGKFVIGKCRIPEMTMYYEGISNGLESSKSIQTYAAEKIIIDEIMEEIPDLEKIVVFYKKDGKWYADMPNHTEEENEMVLGSEDYLDEIADGMDKIAAVVTLDNPGEEAIAHFSLEEHDPEDGGFYHDDFGNKIYICNVAHDIFGEHPGEFWVTRVISREISEHVSD